MSDDLSKQDFKGRTSINTNEPLEIIHWTNKWGITSEVLITAVKETGSFKVKTIENYLIANGLMQ